METHHQSPVTPDPILETQTEIGEKPTTRDTTLEISSLNENPQARPLTYKGTLNHAPVKILIDSGAMGNFISKQTADHFSFALSPVSNIPVVFANGTLGACNKAALATYLLFENHEERLDLRVVSLPHHDIILGQPWLEKWNPLINWKTRTLTFSTETCPLMVKKEDPTATLPECKTPGAAGYDLTATQSFTILPGEQKLVDTGLALAIPEGHYGQLYI